MSTLRYKTDFSDLRSKIEKTKRIMGYTSESGYSSDEDNYYRQELNQFRRKYKVLGLARKSSHAKIYAGNCRKTGQQVVVKVLQKKAKMNKWCPEARAHFAAASADPSGTALLLDVFERTEDILLVIEKPENSLDLLELINSYGPLRLSMVKNIIHQVAQSYCKYKSANIFHGDIKDENILLNPQSGKVKIIDFGNAQKYSETLESTSLGTPDYSPPEATSSKVIKSDSATVYVLGCLAFISLTGECPFDQKYTFDFQRQVLLNPNLDLPEIRFLSKLLHPKPEARELMASL